MKRNWEEMKNEGDYTRLSWLKSWEERESAATVEGESKQRAEDRISHLVPYNARSAAHSVERQVLLSPVQCGN